MLKQMPLIAKTYICILILFWQDVAAPVLGVPVSSAAVERQLSFSDNIIAQKRAGLSPDTVTDIVFNHSYNTVM